jgi:hypothetical protein
MALDTFQREIVVNPVLAVQSPRTILPETLVNVTLQLQTMKSW